MSQEKLDLRLAPAALSAWGAAAVGVGWSPSHAVVGALALLGASALALLVRSRRATPPTGGTGSSGRLVAAVAVMVAAGALGVSGLRAGAIQAGPVPDLARDRAHVEVSAVVDSDPRLREGKFAPYVVVRVNARKVTGRGETTRVRSPLLVIGDRSWMSVHVGDHVQADGRLQVAQGPDLSGVLMGHDAPQVTAPAGLVDRVVGRVRAGLVEAAQPLPAAEQALVPALVDGDDSTMPEQVADDFRTTGLTHLLAVSGSNLTLVLGFVLFVARWCGVRAYGLRVVGLCAVVFFVLLARPEPSVLRAAAMGVVALAGMSAGGRRRGIRALCVAVVVLVLLDPWLARSVGFLLSSLATAGILVLAPRWRAAMSRWMPAILAEAVAVPLAAQLACIPVIAAFSGRVSLVAVLANLLAAPAVGPTTVLGLVAGLLATASAALGHLCGYLAGVPAWWIIWVAQHAAGLEGASMTWPVGVPAIAGLTILCLAIVLLLPRVLRHRSASLCVVSLLVLAVLHPLGRVGWPPDGWVMVMCDVGQGDGMVLNAGRGAAVVVDTGPEPAKMRQCLEELDIDRIALVVLTHYHADHVSGLPAVLDGWSVGEIEVSPLADPPGEARKVTHWAEQAAVPVTVAVAGERRTVGDLTWRVLGPLQTSPAGGDDSGAEGSAPNNASVVMLVRSHGLRVLMSGDAEPPEQGDILATGADLHVDVLKVAHHGSANQDPGFVFASQAPLAVISVGADNDYGHPSAHTLGLLRQLGARVYRTDQDGDIAIVKRAGLPAVVTSE